MREGPTLEFKSDYSKTFLKTVSAFANYDGGEIWFGVNDDGEIIGLNDPSALCLRIESSIDDNLKPTPIYSVDCKKRRGKELVVVKVSPGADTPYCASGKAYKRIHTSTVEVDGVEFKRLVMKGTNTSFEECPAANQKLEFTLLDEMLMKKLGMDSVDDKVYRTLGIFTKEHGFNNAAAVLADSNEFQGVDIVRFGKSISELMERRTVEHVSALKLYDEAVCMFDRYYRLEEVSGFKREESYLVPETAYREALANALVHRNWDVNGSVRISLHDDRVEISSPGGLPRDVSEEDYLAGRLSVLRNPIIADVFAKLGLIEKFGTGIPRIKEAYAGSGLTPRFEISPTSITVSLPSRVVLEAVDRGEKLVLDLLAKYGSMTRSEIEKQLGFSKSKTTRVLKQLGDKRLVEIEGAGRATKYKI